MELMEEWCDRVNISFCGITTSLSSFLLFFKATRRSLDNTDIALAEERAMWSRERHATQSALQKSESQIAHLKAQLQHEAAKRDEGSPHLGGSGEFSEHQHLKVHFMVFILDLYHGYLITQNIY